MISASRSQTYSVLVGVEGIHEDERYVDIMFRIEVLYEQKKDQIEDMQNTSQDNLQNSSSIRKPFFSLSQRCRCWLLIGYL